MITAKAIGVTVPEIFLVRAGRTWHTDMSYTKTPPRGSLFYAREIPIEKGRARAASV